MLRTSSFFLSPSTCRYTGYNNNTRYHHQKKDQRVRYFQYSAQKASEDKQEVEDLPKSVHEVKEKTMEESNESMMRVKDAMIAGTLAFAGIGALSYFHYSLFHENDLTTIIGSVGATAVLVFGAPQAPFSQPRNVLLGHSLASVIGVTCYKFIAVPMGVDWLAVPVSVALSVAAMVLTKSIHPPAGGTALIAVLGSEKIHTLEYMLVAPVGLSAITLVAVGLLNNRFKGRSYPTTWF